MKQLTLLNQSPITRIGIFALFNISDATLSITMTQAGLGVEGNPLLYGQSIWGLLVIKASVIALVALTLAKRWEVMLVLNIGMCIVVYWNLWWYLILR